MSRWRQICCDENIFCRDEMRWNFLKESRLDASSSYEQTRSTNMTWETISFFALIYQCRLQITCRKNYLFITREIHFLIIRRRYLFIIRERHSLITREKHLFITRERHFFIIREKHLFIIRERHFFIIRERHFSIIRERHLFTIREKHLFIIRERHFFIIRKRHFFTIREIYFSIKREITRVHEKNHFLFSRATRSFNSKIFSLSRQMTQTRWRLRKTLSSRAQKK
jgi:hypothetical protein